MHQHAAEKVDMFKASYFRVDSCLYSAKKEQNSKIGKFSAT